MRKIALCLFLFYSCNSFSQTLKVENAKADIDMVISILSEIHPTFNQSPYQQRIISIRDTINHPITTLEFFQIMQPLIVLDGHTTIQYTAKIYPEIPNPFFPFETIIYT